MEIFTFCVFLAPFLFYTVNVVIAFLMVVVTALCYIVIGYLIILCMSKDPTDPMVIKSKFDKEAVAKEFE